MRSPSRALFNIRPIWIALAVLAVLVGAGALLARRVFRTPPDLGTICAWRGKADSIGHRCYWHDIFRPVPQTIVRTC